MDLIIGIVIGAAIFGVILLLVRFARSIKAEHDDRGQDSRSDNGRDSLDRQESRRTSDALQQKMLEASSHDQFAIVLRDIENQRSQLNTEDYNRLVRNVNLSIDGLKQTEAEKAKIEPKLAAFRQLKSVTDPEALFIELHRIYLSDQDSVISVDELDDHGEKGEYEWFARTYDTLLVEYLRTLLIAARHGTLVDYKKVMQLWEELSDFLSNESEGRQEFVTKHLASEWNEMIVRFKRSIEWEDLMGIDDLGENDYKVIINKARQEHDLLSLRMYAFFDEQGDSVLAEALVEIVTEEFRSDLEAQLLATGFIAGEQERRA